MVEVLKMVEPKPISAVAVRRRDIIVRSSSPDRGILVTGVVAQGRKILDPGSRGCCGRKFYARLRERPKPWRSSCRAAARS
jgi:hypothetical protein